MAEAYILTKEGRRYSEEGIKYVLGQIRNTFNDHSDVNLSQGRIWNKPSLLLDYLKKGPENTYVFISHDKGIEILHDKDDLARFMGLLENEKDPSETSWTIIMKAIGLL